MKISFELCNFKNPDHLIALSDLMLQYMNDPMGDAPELTESQQLLLVNGLSGHPAAFVLFILADGVIAGLATCFINFSTFYVKSYLNIHDVIVDSCFRGKGIGKRLLQELVSVSKERGYCKLTLEVREDNAVAQSLYRSLNFEECEPKMFFWTKKL